MRSILLILTGLAVLAGVASMASAHHRPCHRPLPCAPTPTATPTPSPTPTPTPDPGTTTVIAGAGDIAGGASGTRDDATADLLDRINPAAVFTTGDNAYEDGTLQEYMAEYHPTWGRQKAKTHPAPGNHEYHVPGAPGYFDYFGAAAGERGKGYYSWELAEWHLVALNSNLSMAAGSVQEQWLRQDLAAAGPGCIAAYWHHPRWTSSSQHGPFTASGAIWQALYDHGADLVLNGHNHQYERFAPQNPAGQADTSRGIREIVVGTGGAGLYSFGSPRPNSEVRNGTTHGVLKLTLRGEGYDWKFEPILGQTFTDSGTATCHSAEPAPAPPTAAGQYAFSGLFEGEPGGGLFSITSLGFSLIDSGSSNETGLTAP